MVVEGKIVVAAAGDVHASEPTRDHLTAAVAEAAGRADLILFAGDVTRHGEPAEAAVLADACRGVGVPVYAVLGNHDFHAGRADELAATLREAGVVVLDRSSARTDVRGVEVGIVGTKGFVGGFPGSWLPDFGEPLLRQVYAETTEEVRALERGLAEIAGCALRIVLLHYSPSLDTLAGEPEGIWVFLGSMRLAGPISEHHPDLVVHGHAHEGTFAGHIGGVPVYNVAQPVIRRDFWLFELQPEQRPAPPRAAVEARPG